jgi:hypothetical protein
MVTDFTAEGGVYVTVHALPLDPVEASVHVLLEKVPPAPPSLQDIVPVGTVLVPPVVSLTFAVKLIVLPIVTVAGLGVTFVLVLRLLTVNADVPELVP